jgi:hypothetical protein
MKNLLRVTLNLFALLSSSLLLSQCDTTDVALPQSEEAPFAVSSKQAMEVAQRYIASLQKQQAEKGGARASSVTEVVGEETIVDEVDKKPLFHVINRTKGFIIVSADLRTMPVLAYSDESHFDTGRMPFGVKDWFESAKLKIKDARTSEKTADSIVVKEWRKYLSGKLNLPASGAKVRSTNCQEWYQYGQYMCQNTSTTRGPLLNTHWGQGQISTTSLTWNYKNCDGCGRFLAGCGPVAMAQVHEYYLPNSARPRRSNSSCTATTAGEYDLSQLMLACGNAAQSRYDYLFTCNTYTRPGDVSNGFRNLGFSNGGNTNAGYDYQIIRTELSANHPLIFWGSTCLACFENYHIWVADGLQENNYSEFSCETLQCNQWAYSYVHMNWGWDEEWDGWYAYGQYNPRGEDYNANLHIISSIRP